MAVNTLEYLKKSGRVTAAGAAIGTILNIKPVLQIQGGKLDAYRKARGMRPAMQTMTIGLVPLPISISCHTGDGALGVGMMKDIL